MCGRFYLDDDTAAEIIKIVRRIDSKKFKTGDVFPSDPAMVLRAEQKEMVAEVMEWGYNNLPGGKLLINARSETVMEKPLFRKDYEMRRCMIPARMFYEWKRKTPKDKEKYEFYVPNKILYLAGIYQLSPEGSRFTIITKAAEGCMQDIHNRMPVILHESEREAWLYSREHAGRLLEGHFHELQTQKSSGAGYEQLSLI